jgi:hypothetical protein
VTLRSACYDASRIQAASVVLSPPQAMRKACWCVR